jgi:hypothetical protein
LGCHCGCGRGGLLRFSGFGCFLDGHY